ncbi:hypothetical protein [Okeania hirsuta]|uniref:hypothetical protein n=1 Tax=Okeania hirsuta TaxID=1458930 RepID=UPI001291DD69|nr:hypothetical protein [Okeania hirsuta]
MDGENGANPPSYIIEPLKANTSYSGTIVILNKRVSPALTLPPSYRQKAKIISFFTKQREEQMQLSPIPIRIMTAIPLDHDNPNHGSPGSGKINIRLVYQPEKDATGVASGDLTNAKCRTDKIVSFDVLIQ